VFTAVAGEVVEVNGYRRPLKFHMTGIVHSRSPCRSPSLSERRAVDGGIRFGWGSNLRGRKPSRPHQAAIDFPRSLLRAAANATPGTQRARSSPWQGMIPQIQGRSVRTADPAWGDFTRRLQRWPRAVETLAIDALTAVRGTQRRWGLRSAFSGGDHRVTARDTGRLCPRNSCWISSWSELVISMCPCGAGDRSVGA
jgi:hypothetical protein